MSAKNTFVLSLLLLIIACGPSSENWQEQWLPVMIENPAPVSDFTNNEIAGEPAGMGLATPDGDAFDVYLLAGPANGALNALPMFFDVGSGYYKTEFFCEATQRKTKYITATNISFSLS